MGPKRRRNILISLALLLVCFVVVLWLVLRPNYTVVMTDLDATSLGDAETQLSTLKIPYQLQGSSILVPSKDADQARIQLAEAGLPKSGYIGYSSVSSSFGTTQDQFNIEVLDALQQSLNSTIDSINGIENAQVHIVMPSQQLFVSSSDSDPAKASVFVQLGTGVQLSSDQVTGIQQLVAHSVPGLTTDNVSVVDQYGDTLSQSADSADGTQGTDATNEIAVRDQLEQEMTDELTNGLAKIVGEGNAVVAVHANVTFNQTESTTKNVLPAPNQTSGLITNQTTSSSTTGSGSTASGVAGQSSTNPNLSSYAGSSNSTGSPASTTTNQTTTYATGSQTITTVADPMQVNGYTVGVFLNSQDKSLNAKTVSQIKQFVNNAIGATGSTNTANSVFVTTVPFQNQPTFTQTGHSKWWLWAVIGAAVLALAGLLLWLRRRQTSSADEGVMGEVVPIQDIPEQPFEQNVNEDEQMRRQLAKLANQKPEEFANLVRTWLVSD